MRWRARDALRVPARAHMRLSESAPAAASRGAQVRQTASPHPLRVQRRGGGRVRRGVAGGGTPPTPSPHRPQKAKEAVESGFNAIKPLPSTPADVAPPPPPPPQLKRPLLSHLFPSPLLVASLTAPLDAADSPTAAHKNNKNKRKAPSDASSPHTAPLVLRVSVWACVCLDVRLRACATVDPTVL